MVYTGGEKEGGRGPEAKKIKNKKVSEVGFEPTPTFVDYDLNVAP